MQGGVLHTLEVNEELAPQLQETFSAYSGPGTIQLHIGEALQIIPTLTGIFDLVFIDADKKNNLAYFEKIIDRVRPGGLIVIDNVLWKGKVLDENPDRQTQDVLHLNQIIAADTRVDKIILPVRDGVFLIRKRK